MQRSLWSEHPRATAVGLGAVVGLLLPLVALFLATWSPVALVAFFVIGGALGALAGYLQHRLAAAHQAPHEELAVALSRLSNGEFGLRLSEHDGTPRAREFNVIAERLQSVFQEARASAMEAMTTTARIESEAHELALACRANAGGEAAESLALVDTGIAQVSSKAQSLSSGVEEMSFGMEGMLASITEVTSNANSLSLAVAQTSSGIEEMATAIQHVANSVVEANRVADLASRAAHTGQDAVGQTIQGMEQISHVMGDMVAVITQLGQNSAEIGNIVEVIEDIADQTNLLALNAAIEAARAGEVGRGFAVVADEVRKLAERSGKATKEIAGIIKGIQTQIAQATQLTSQGDTAIHAGISVTQGANASLQDIVAAVEQVRSLIIDIANAAEEQARASEVISTAVSSGAAMSVGSLSERMMVATQSQQQAADQIIGTIDTIYGLAQEILAGAEHQRQLASEAHRSFSAGSAPHPATETLPVAALELKHRLSHLLDSLSSFARSGERSVIIHPAAQPALTAER